VLKGYGLKKAEATMPVTVRRATPADAPVIVEFNRRLAEESEGKALDVAVLSAGVAAVMADPHKGPYFLAEEAGQVVGQMQVTYEFSDWRNGWFWWIQGVYIVPQARRQGIFRALYEHVAAEAKRDPEVVGLRLYVERDNERAHKTYLGLGMHWTSYLMMERFPL
jgi:ribosomal protein S18 acetylase RimI-like enzyme